METMKLMGGGNEKEREGLTNPSSEVSSMRGWRESEAVKRSFGVSDLSDRVSDVQGSARALANTPIQEAGMNT